MYNSAGYKILQANATNWLRINDAQQFPAIALYKPVAIGTGGLAVGEWSQQPQGVLKVTQSAYLATSGGNVGIGTTNPNSKLQIDDQSASHYIGRYDPTCCGSSQIPANQFRGFTVSWDTDLAMFGLRDYGGDRNDVVINNEQGGDNIRFQIAGSDVMFIRGSDGNVGIGTTNPNRKLQVNGTIYVSGNDAVWTTSNWGKRIELSNGGIIQWLKGSGTISRGIGLTTNDTFYFIRSTADDNSSSPIYDMVINGNGNVGIGTTAPSHKLSIAGGYQTTGLSGEANQLHIGASGTSPNAAQIVWGDNTGWKLNFGTRVSGTFTERVTILDTGNVGIGTTNPQRAKLVVEDSVVSPISPPWGGSANTHAFSIMAYDPSPPATDKISYAIQGTAKELGTTSVSGHRVGTNGILIKSDETDWYLSGSLGQQSGSNNRAYGVVSYVKSCPSGYQCFSGFFNGGSSNPYPFVVETGNVGIGTTNPGTYKLYVVGTAYSTGGWQTSDIRLKNKIEDLDNVLDKIKNLETFKFTWKKDQYPDKGLPDGAHLGISAQQIQQVFPELVNYDNEGFLAVDYAGLSVINLKAIKEQQNQIENLNKTLSLTSSGDVVIENTSEEYVYDGVQDFENQKSTTSDVIKSQNYNLKLKTGEIIERIGAFAEIVAAKIKAGLIEAENTIVNNTLLAKNIVSESINLTTENLTIAGKKLTDYIDERVNQILASRQLFSASEKIISPVVETEEIKLKAQNSKLKTTTDSAKLQIIDSQDQPVAEFKTDEKQTSIFGSLNVESNQEKGKLAQIVLKNLEGKSAVVIDASGNASFSGQVTVSSLVSDVGNLGNLIAKEASVEGKLVAKEVEAENIDNLTKTVFEQRQSLSETTNTINEIQRLLAQIQNKPLPDVSNQTNLSNTTDFNQFQPVSTSFNDLTVTGSSNLYNVSVSGSILAGQLFIENNSIVSLGQELKLSALSKINLFDGAVTIAKDGTITTKGILIAEAGIKTDTIAPQSEDNLNILGNLNVLGNLSLPKATDSAIIAASDNFAKNGIFAPAIETATASAGFGILPKNSSEVIIYNDNVREYSLVYLTPTTNTNSQLSVIEKKYCDSQTTENCKPYFKVVTSLPENQDIKFDWLIIN
ncbi:MAG: hypothetical protein KatS3mg092_0467 [Patescibacteria group bacterium]|nr:MAG: hypothetical protein KatS3mg092_0467 [Patescibacteria group bacterium]